MPGGKAVRTVPVADDDGDARRVVRRMLEQKGHAVIEAADVAARLDRPERTVRLWCKQGRFAGARSVTTPRGDYWLIPAAALKDFQAPERGRPAKQKAEGGAKPRQAAKRGGRE